MKKIKSLLLFVLPAFAVFYACNGQGGHAIKGTITGAANLQVLLEQAHFDRSNTALGKATCDAAGNFEIKSEKPWEQGLYRMTIGAKRLFFVLDGKETTVEIKGDLNTLDRMAVEVKGSETFTCYANIVQEAFKTQLKTPEEAKAAINKGCNPFMKAILTSSFLGNNAASFMEDFKSASAALNEYMPGSKYATDYANMVNSLQSQIAQQQAGELIKVGQPAPEISLPGPDGKVRSLSAMGTRKALALTTDCNSAYVYADPYKGGMIAVAEAARNIVCAGGEPVAITNCLNFGNPYNPEVYYQFAQAIRGMGDACRKFGTPVTGGNVSFYNQYSHKGKTIPVYPTPTIGMLGILDDYEQMMTLDFKKEGDKIYLVGASRSDLGSSEYLRGVLKKEFSPCPYFDLEEEYAVQSVIQKVIKSHLAESAHDVSDGGLITALLESAMPRGLGFEVNSNPSIRKDAWLFGEAQSRVIVSVRTEQVAAFERLLKSEKTPFEVLGTVTGRKVQVDGEDWGNVSAWKRTYDTVLGKMMSDE